MDLHPLRGVLRHLQAVSGPRRFNVTYTLMAVLCRCDDARHCQKQTAAAIKRLCLSLVKRSTPPATTLLKAKPTSLKPRRYRCGLPDDYLLQTLTAGDSA